MSMNELFQSLQMFQQGMGELATGRAVRGAADMAQQINMNEKDEFEKRRQLTQIGTGLAAQLSAMGTNQAQIQSSVGAIMPQQLQGPQDFFQQAAMAKTTDAKNQYQQAGNQIQNGLAAAPLNSMQKEQVRQSDYSNKTSRLALLLSASGAGQNGKDAKPLPAEQVEKISKNESALKNMDEMLSTINTNPDFVGLDKKFTDSDWLANASSRNDPQFAAFKSMVVENFDQYRHEITGAGAGPEELKMLERSRPSITDSPGQFMAKLQTAIKIGEDKRYQSLTNFGRAGYNMSAFSADPLSKFGAQLKQQKVQMRQDDASLELLLKASQQNPKLLTPEQRQKIDLLKEVKSRGKL